MTLSDIFVTEVLFGGAEIKYSGFIIFPTNTWDSCHESDFFLNLPSSPAIYAPTIPVNTSMASCDGTVTSDVVDQKKNVYF